MSSCLRRMAMSTMMIITASSISAPKTAQGIHSGFCGTLGELTNDTPSPATARINMQRKIVSAMLLF